MEIAKVFQSGNLQAIRFPKTFHLVVKAKWKSTIIYISEK